MKTILPALLAGLSLILAGRATAQTFTTLHSFNFSDGYSVDAGLILSGNTLYGTTYIGGSSNWGTVFSINTDGTGFTNLHNFTGGSDGGNPEAGLISSGNTLYGTTISGGSSGNGTVFAVNTNGAGFTNLYDFSPRSDNSSGRYTNSDGANPFAGLILSGNTLYGTAYAGGSSNWGTVFAVNTDGTGFTNLHSFIGNDGSNPTGELVLSGNTLYGTTFFTVFSVNTDGTGFTNLHVFTFGGDGENPVAGLVLSGNTLYGTAAGGGSSGSGTVFAVNINGTGFTNLYSFTASSTNSSGSYTNSDGANPYGKLVLSGNTLYGTAAYGASSGNGTVFAVNINGTGFANVYNFTASRAPYYTNSDGCCPQGGLFFSVNTLYGTARGGGTSGYGTVFSLSLPVRPPQLTLASDGYGGYSIRVQGAPNLTCRLQRAHSLTGPWTTSAPQTAPASGLLEFHDLFPPSDRAFYRTLQP